MRITKKMFEPLDDYEKDLIEVIEKNNFTPLKGKAKRQEIEMLKQAVDNTVALRQQINIRMNLNDIKALKQKSSQLGIPYQTLLNTLVHQYVTGKITLTL